MIHGREILPDLSLPNEVDVAEDDARATRQAPDHAAPAVYDH
jgi:hypothetical protein